MRTVPRSQWGGRSLPWIGPVVFLVFFVGAPAALAQTEEQPKASPSVQIPERATVESLFVDFLHYARMGRFTLAEAYAQALLAREDLDPVVILEAANRDKKSVDTLLILIRRSPTFQNSTLGENAAKVLQLIQQGENFKRQDAERIRDNIVKLGGNPQQEFFGTRHLAESGEYAIPDMLQALLDPTMSELRPRVAIALAKMGKDAVGPLVAALGVRDDDVRLHLIRALGDIGYPQAVPYLSRLILDDTMPPATKEAAAAAIDRIGAVSGRSVPGTPDEQFFWLGEKFYNEDDSVRADPRLDTANVWYWDKAGQVLTRTVVTEEIFGPVMAMRCCEEALLLRRDHADSIALWLAANIRRESRLGMNTESGDPAEAGDPDDTRPDVFPRALYFSQAAGPRYAHLVLDRAIRDNDPAVALGAIEALRITAGASSLIGAEDYKQPLVQALRFPDLLVRIRAALALGTALPKTPFADSQFVVPVLATAVTLTGREQVLVVDADEANLNRLMDGLRSGDRIAIGETGFHRGMQRVRDEFQTLEGVFVAADIAEPGLAAALGGLRAEFAYSKTPVVVLSKPERSLAAEEVCSADGYAECVDAGANVADVEAAWERARTRTGRAALTADLARAISLEALEALRRIALDGQTVYDVVVAEAAVLSLLAAPDEALQLAAIEVLALTRSPESQRGIAGVAVDDARAESLRIAAFGALAESAKRFGNLAADGQVPELIRVARADENLTLRTAASRALGALNLSSNQASEILRSYSGG